MVNRNLFPFLFLGFGLIVLSDWGCTSKTATTADVDGEALFVHEIQPILERKCMSCHGQTPEDLEGGFDMRSRASLLAGGESGKAAILPGNPDDSPLIQAIKRLDLDKAMPPKQDESLAEDEIELFEDWVAANAPWPDKARQAEILADGEWEYGNRVVVKTSGGQSEDWEKRRYKTDKLWAFLPLLDIEIPKSSSRSKSSHPIDAFIDRKLASLGLKAAEKADKRTLIRRATFDLTGLPPTAAETEAFLADSSPEAFEKIIDRLLKSPHYGEQWGRHWLDVVRYADSDGYANDYIRPNAWRYRDYVIRAFNADKPYNEFIMEQLAGDEMNPEDPEMLVAAGFLRMGPWEHTGMSIAAETRQVFLDDVTNIVGETFLSLPLGCAKCHDHKYDPIPTKDYYSIQAVFAPVQFASRAAAYLAAENRTLAEPEQKRLVTWMEKTKAEQAALVEKEEAAAKEWFQSKGKRYMPKRMRRKLPDDQQPPRYYGLTFQDLGYRKVLSKRMQALRRTRFRFEPYAYSVYNGPNRLHHSARDFLLPAEIEDAPPSTFILGGGSVYAPEQEVEAGILSAVATLKQPLDEMDAAEIPNPIPQSLNGRRLAFAEWLAQGDHPLVTRSIVNRIWQYHFGKGLSESTNNFGGTGRPPTHPELLDWLAQNFVQNGWSLKSLHRLIMTSSAYQRSSEPAQADGQALLDPDNHFLASFSARRMAAEEMRDAMLFASGEINLELGGLPVRPEINEEIALQPRHTMGSIAQAYQASRTPAERNRRTIYAERYRNLPNPMLSVFNQPTPDLSCERRSTSTVTPQVFSLLNSPQMRDRAIALAIRATKEASSDLAAQIRHTTQLIWGRLPTSKELKQSQTYVQNMIAYHEEQAPVKPTYPTQIKRKMFEEMTGESFEYMEELDIYQNYEPDQKDADVSVTTRALADLALVLFNTNEFIYVY